MTRTLRFAPIALALAFAAPALRAQQPSAPLSAGVLRLEDLEKAALERNPEVRAAAARRQAASGRTLQAGLYPNPVLGYEGDEIASGPISRGGEHGFFFEQEIVLGGRLGRAKDAAASAESQAAAEQQLAEQRVRNTVRALYYRALVAEQLVEARNRYASIAKATAQISADLLNIGQANPADLLEAESESVRASLASSDAELERDRVWHDLAALTGLGDEPRPLAGNLEDSVPALDRAGALEAVLRDSPEIRSEEAGVQRAERIVARERAARVPDLMVRGGVLYNRELLENNLQPVGLEGFAQIGVRLPLFNRNQGNIAAARAELGAARSAEDQTRLRLRMRLERAWRDYQSALARVQSFRSGGSFQKLSTTRVVRDHGNEVVRESQGGRQMLRSGRGESG